MESDEFGNCFQTKIKKGMDPGTRSKSVPDARADFNEVLKDIGKVKLRQVKR